MFFVSMNGILFITVDCLRSDHMGCYGYNRPTTPNIDSLAESGTLYKNSYANCPSTRWAFQSLHTGISAVQIDGIGVPNECETLASKLLSKGYETGWFGINAFVSREYCYQKGFNKFYGIKDTIPKQSFIYKVGKQIHNSLNSEFIYNHIINPVYKKLYRRSQLKTGRYRPPNPDKQTVDRALDFINDKLNNSNFLCWVHFMDAHTPYGRYPKHLQAIRGDTSIEHVIKPHDEGKADQPHESVIDTYDACIRNVDEQVGRLLDRVPEETMVVLTGDHGEEFGRYQPHHRHSMYSSYTQVPIIIRDKGLPNSRKESPAQHLDLMPTILRRANIKIPDYFEGIQLQDEKRTKKEPIYFGFDRERGAIRIGDWKYMDYPDPELYNTPHSGIDGEPVTEQYPDKTSELRGLLEEYRSSPMVGKGKSNIYSNDNKISETIEENLEDLGYL